MDLKHGQSRPQNRKYQKVKYKVPKNYYYTFKALEVSLKIIFLYLQGF